MTSGEIASIADRAIKAFTEAMHSIASSIRGSNETARERAAAAAEVQQEALHRRPQAWFVREEAVKIAQGMGNSDASSRAVAKKAVEIAEEIYRLTLPSID